jgi:hypothetical protein
MNFELLYELEAKITKSVEIGGGFGAGRTDFHLEGRVQGKVNGSYEGIDYGSMIRTDAGEAVYVHVHETIRTGGGIVSALRRGYAIPSKEGGIRCQGLRPIPDRHPGAAVPQLDPRLCGG